MATTTHTLVKCWLIFIAYYQSFDAYPARNGSDGQHESGEEDQADEQNEAIEEDQGNEQNEAT